PDGAARVVGGGVPGEAGAIDGVEVALGVEVVGPHVGGGGDHLSRRVLHGRVLGAGLAVIVLDRAVIEVPAEAVVVHDLAEAGAAAGRRAVAAVVGLGRARLAAVGVAGQALRRAQAAAAQRGVDEGGGAGEAAAAAGAAARGIVGEVVLAAVAGDVV